MNKFAITNAKCILPDAVITSATVLVEGKKIIKVKKGSAVPRGVTKINARGNFVSPGFIDLHIHGDVKRISSEQAKGGTVGFLATLHPQSPSALLKSISDTLKQRAALSGAKLLGLRLEGPFINRNFAGALSQKTLRLPSIAEAKRMLKASAGALKMVVIAPELKGAPKLISFFRKYNVIASLGHTGATYRQAQEGIEAGVNHATHMFNRIRGLIRRDPGASAAALTDQRVFCEVIPDGIHVHPALLKLLLSCKGTDKTILITDSTAAQGLPNKKRYGQIYKLKNGTLYGTALTLNKALSNIVKFTGLSLACAVKLVSLNPARLLRIDKRKGSLSAGKDADIVIFDKNFKVKMTIIEGKIVFSE